MPIAYKVLGQSCPSGTSDTTLYTVPSATSAVVSSIVISNITGTLRQFRIAVRPAGAAIANQHYVAYDVGIAGNDTTILTIGITLAATDVLTVRSSSASAITFQAYGSEITA